MRVTSSDFPATFSGQLQDLLRQQLTMQQQAATGLRINKSSDDPIAYQRTLTAQAELASHNAFLDVTQEVSSLATYNHDSMTTLQKALARAGEVANKVNGTYSDSDLMAMGEEIDSILSQVSQLANKQKDGHYLFGGTIDEQPIAVTSGDPNTYAYNYDTNSSVTKAQLSAGTSALKTGILAGRPADSTDVTSTAVNGFLYETGGATTIDTIDTLTQLRDQLYAGQSGIPTIQNTLLTRVNQSTDLASKYVGLTAATLAVVDNSSSDLKSQIVTDKTRISNASSASLTDTAAYLTQLQTNYQAALQAGAKILNLSIMDYL